MKLKYGLMAIILIFLIILPNLSLFVEGEFTTGTDSDFDDGIIGEIITPQTFFNSTGKSNHNQQDGGLQLAPIFGFTKLKDALVLDIDWYNGIAAILLTDGLYKFTAATGTMTTTPIFSLPPSPSIYSGIVCFMDDGTIFIATGAREIIQSKLSVTLTFYRGLNIDSDIVEVGQEQYLAKHGAHFYAKESFGDYILFGGRGFLAKYEPGVGVTILDNTLVHSKMDVTHTAFDTYYFDLTIQTFPGVEDFDFDIPYTKSGNLWTFYDIPMSPLAFDLPTEVFQPLDYVDESYIIDLTTGQLETKYDYIFSLLYVVSITWLINLRSHQIRDIIATEENTYMVGEFGTIINYIDGGTSTIERFTGTGLSDYYQLETLDSIINGDSGIWMSSYGAFSGLRSIDGTVVSDISGCHGISYHPIHGYLWTINGAVHFTKDPLSGTIREESYSSVLGNTNYILHPDVTGGYCLMQGYTTLGLLEMRNFCKDGYYISPTYNVNMELPDDDEGSITIQSYITHVNITWDHDVPIGTSYKAYVSNNGGSDWTEYIKGSGLVVFTNTGPDYHVFAYRFTKESDADQLRTPTIWNLEYIIQIEEIHQINGELEGKVVFDPHHPTGYLTYEPVNFTATGFDPDSAGAAMFYEWDFDDPFGVHDFNNDGIDENPNTRGGINLWNDTHIYTIPGEYSVNVSATVGNITVSDLIPVTIHNRNPWAIIDEGDNEPVLVNETLILHSTGSYDEDGIILKYEWKIAGQTISTLPTLTHTFTESGNRTINLFVYDDRDAFNSVGIRIHVTDTDKYPDADYSVSSNRPQFGTPVTFTSLSTDDFGIVNYTWDFGDGEMAYTSTVIHTYTEPGRYTVYHSVTDTIGQMAWTEIHTISVTPMPPVGDWRVSSHIIIEGWLIMMEGDIIIEQGGWLELKSSNIIFKARHDGQYGFRVDYGGKLTAPGSAIGPWWHYDGETLIFQYNYWFFENSGTIYLNNTVIRGADEDKSANRVGITQYDKSELFMISGKVFGCENAAISTYTPTLLFAPQVTVTSTVIELSPTGIYVNGGDVTLSAARIYTTIRAVNHASGNLTITDNTRIRGATEQGIYYGGGVLSVDNSTIQFCGNGIEVNGNALSFADNKILGSGNTMACVRAYKNCYIYRCYLSNAQWGIHAIGATVHTIGTEVNGNTIHYQADGGGRIHVDNYLLAVVTWRGDMITGATVTIRQDGETIYTGNTTNGYYGPTLLSYAIITPGSRTFPEYTISVAYGGLIDSQTPDMNDHFDGVVTVVFEFNPPVEPEPPAEPVPGILEVTADQWTAIIIIIVIGIIIGIILYIKRDDEDFIEKYRLWVIVGGVIASLVTWFSFVPFDWETLTPYIAIGGLWAGVIAVMWIFRDVDFIEDNRIRILIIMAIVSIILWLWLTGETFYLMVMIIIGVLIGVLLFLFRAGLIPGMSSGKE